MWESNYSRPITIGLYCIFLIVIYVIFATTGEAFSILGYRIDLLPVIVVCVGFIDGSLAGAIVGFLAGVLYDINSVSVEGLYPAFYMFVGAFCGALSKKYFLKILPSAIILTILTLFCMAMLRAIFFFFSETHMDVTVFLHVFFGETLLSILFSPLAFYPIKYIMELFTKKQS